MDTQYTNALIHETSPYLLQHAHNPVQWHPWTTAVLARAQQEHKPILLSIGYSACHWCHVMAHESFEDEETARVMNEHFINIKVDREERPDLDKIYQRAHQLLAQRPGGWPLTMFLTPGDQIPFFAGTYFPKQTRYNLPAFKEMLLQISEFHQHRADELTDQNQALMRAMQELQPVTSSQARLTPAPLDTGRRQLEKNMDWQEGGFGKAPKFPHVTSLEQLLRHWSGSRQRDQRALDMVTFTLRKMALGGINDQLGGGFCRYSVDDLWMIPHFEKMLYDNGPLLSLYTQAWVATREPLFREVMKSTAQWVIREMQSPEGGYYSAQDADSEGEEGKFYAWSQEQIKSLLEPEEYQAFARRFGLDREANFEGKWYPHVFTDWDALATELSADENQLKETIQHACDKLFAARELRIRPGTDDKILTSWNALMIKGMTMAGRQLQRPDLIASAEQALDFIRATLWKDSRLLATYKDGRAHLNAYLDDYAFLIDAILELLQTRWRHGDLDFAIALCETMLNHFEDKEHGGFFFTADDHEQLIQRLKPLGDESIPAGNGVAALVLARMGHLLAETRYLEASERTLHAAWPSIEQLPYAHNSLLMALEEQLYPPQTIVLRGTVQDTLPWLQRCQQQYAPRRITIAIPNEANRLPGVLNERSGETGKVLAYVCSGTSCSAPVESLDELEEMLI